MSRSGFAAFMASLAISTPRDNRRRTREGRGRKTLYYWHTRNAGSHPVPGGGNRERMRRVAQMMKAEAGA